MKIFGTHDPATIQQLQTCLEAEEGAIGALMADGHKGYSMPIGGVVGYTDHISPSGVGFDIACGVLAAKTPIHVSEVPTAQMTAWADAIASTIQFGIGKVNHQAPQDHPIFDRINEDGIPQQQAMLGLARQQLGTVGSGNHYVDLLSDRGGYIWVAVHFGSRGFGYKTAQGFLNLSEGRPWDAHRGKEEERPCLLRTDQPLGQDYIQAMTIAGEYAYAGRSVVVNRVLRILDESPAIYSVHNHHNFAWQEWHGGRMRWVVRKGATPAYPGQRGFVGGSMGDMSVLVEGVESVSGPAALYSTVHGAGRIMSRTQAAGKVKRRWHWQCGHRSCGAVFNNNEQRRTMNGTLPHCPSCGGKLHKQWTNERIREGAVDWEAAQEMLKAHHVILRGGGPDEAPEVYRPLGGVLDDCEGTIRIVEEFWPLVAVMAGRDEADPFQE